MNQHSFGSIILLFFDFSIHHGTRRVGNPADELTQDAIPFSSPYHLPLFKPIHTL